MITARPASASFNAHGKIGYEILQKIMLGHSTKDAVAQVGGTFECDKRIEAAQDGLDVAQRLKV